MPIFIEDPHPRAGPWLRDLDLVLPQVPDDDLKRFLDQGINNVPWCTHCVDRHRAYCRTALTHDSIRRCTNCVHDKISCDLASYSLQRLVWMLTRLVRGFGAPIEQRPERWITLGNGQMLHLVLDVEGRPTVAMD